MTGRACSRCGDDVAVYPPRCPVYCAPCRREYNREYMRRKRGSYQRHCQICGVEVPHVRAYCSEHRVEATRRIKRESAKRRRLEAKRSNRQFEQLRLPLRPILRLIELEGLSINSLGARDAKMIHRGQCPLNPRCGSVPLHWADDFIVGVLGMPDVFDQLASEAV